AVGRAGHALDPARDQDVRLAAADGAGRLVDGGERAGAKAVRRDARHAVRQAGEQGAHAGDVAVVLARLVGAAEIDLLDGVGSDAGLFHRGPDDVPGQIVGADRRQRATDAADRRADGAEDVD